MAPSAPDVGPRHTAPDAVDPDEDAVDGADAAPSTDEVLHDARVELDEWRRSMRMDPLEG